MDVPITIASMVNPHLDAIRHSHIWTCTKEALIDALQFILPNSSVTAPLITWTEIKVTWTGESDHAFARLLLIGEAETIRLSPPFNVKRGLWTPLEWLIPSIPMENYRLGIEIESQTLNHNGGTVNLKVAGFEQLLRRAANYVFTDFEGKPKWNLMNHDGLVHMMECKEIVEGAVILTPLPSVEEIEGATI